MLQPVISSSWYPSSFSAVNVKKAQNQRFQASIVGKAIFLPAGIQVVNIAMWGIETRSSPALGRSRPSSIFNVVLARAVWAQCPKISPVGCQKKRHAPLALLDAPRNAEVSGEAACAHYYFGVFGVCRWLFCLLAWCIGLKVSAV